MGKPSDKRRSARRPGRHERARVKNHYRGSFSIHVPGAGTIHVKAGRKKIQRFMRWYVSAHLSVTPNSESAGER